MRSRLLDFVTVGLPVTLLIGQPVQAVTCTVPNIISNGQVADAKKIMDNFNTVADCAESAITITGTPNAGSLAIISGANTIGSSDLTGDVSTVGSTVATLANSGVTPGTYVNPTIMVDAKGRVTAASSGTNGGGGGGVSPLKHSMLVSYASLANTNEQIASSYTAPFGSIRNGAVIKLHTSGSLAATTRLRNFRIRVAGGPQISFQTTSDGNIPFKMDITLTRRNSQTLAVFYEVDFGNASGNSTSSFVNSYTWNGTTLDLDSNVTFEVVTQTGAGAVASDIIVRQFNIEIMNID